MAVFKGVVGQQVVIDEVSVYGQKVTAILQFMLNGNGHVVLRGTTAGVKTGKDFLDDTTGGGSPAATAMVADVINWRCQEFCVNGFRLVDGFRLHWLHLGGG